MGFMHIDNLSKNAVILLYRECYAMEKIHGTSAHVTLERMSEHEATVKFFSGGASQGAFDVLFDRAKLIEEFLKLGHQKLTIFGEAYGGSMQKMKHVYGDKLKFVAFEALHGEESWLDVPTAEKLALDLGLDFVPYARVSTDLEALDKARRQSSRQAKKNGVEGDHLPEGIVCRPLVEMADHRGNRVIVKYKNPEFSERESKRDTIANPDKALELANADAVAMEWVTDMRLVHVLDKLSPPATELKDIPRLVTAMLEDVGREGAGEVDVTQKLVKQAIGTRTVKLYKAKLAVELVPA